MALFHRRHTAIAREMCTLQPNSEDTMEDFRVETMKAIWQAFAALDTAESGLVHVSQLKVITSNVGMKLGFDKAEELLNAEGLKSMDFKSYFDIVKAELIDKMDDSEQNGKKPLAERLNSIIKSCWMFCNFERLHKSKWLSSDHCLVLWRLFNFLAESDESGEPVLPVQLHSEEASMLLKNFVDVTGQKNKEQVLKDSLSGVKSEGLSFTDFLNVFEKECVTNLSKGDITHGLNHLQDTYLLNILGKGMVWKRGFKVKMWKERWFVMTPKELKYYVTSNEKVLKGCIEFDEDCKVEVQPDRPTHKPNRFVIQTKRKPYEMSAPDMKTKHEWVSGVQMALDHIGKDTHIQKEAARMRCKARRDRKRELEEEERRRKEDAEFMKQQQGELDEEKRKRLEDEELLRKRLAELEEEKRKREEAEARFLEERALKEAEQQRLRELEEIRKELERLLEEERQAKKDEEIVRNLQARLLEEEFERREELERLKQQQEDMLKSEREKKAMLEVDKQEQEARFREAQRRLEELETERANAAQKMQEATEKLQKAEKDRHIMEEKVKLWKTPVGLARPIQPTANPLITHRGLGAFCEKDFVSREKLLSDSDPLPNDEEQKPVKKESEDSENDQNKNSAKKVLGDRELVRTSDKDVKLDNKPVNDVEEDKTKTETTEYHNESTAEISNNVVENDKTEVVTEVMDAGQIEKHEPGQEMDRPVDENYEHQVTVEEGKDMKTDDKYGDRYTNDKTGDMMTDDEKRDKTDNENGDMMTDHENRDMMTGIENRDVKTDEQNRGMKVDYKNGDMVTDDEKSDMKTSDENRDMMNDDENRDKMTDDEYRNKKTDEEAGISPIKETENTFEENNEVQIDSIKDQIEHNIESVSHEITEDTEGTIIKETEDTTERGQADEDKNMEESTNGNIDVNDNKVGNVDTANTEESGDR